MATNGNDVLIGTAGPDLLADQNGAAWLVGERASAGATDRFWRALLDPSTYNP